MQSGKLHLIFNNIVQIAKQKSKHAILGMLNLCVLRFVLVLFYYVVFILYGTILYVFFLISLQAYIIFFSILLYVIFVCRFPSLLFYSFILSYICVILYCVIIIYCIIRSCVASYYLICSARHISISSLVSYYLALYVLC